MPNYYSILVKKGRNKFIEYLNSNGISTNIYYKKPIHLQSAMRKIPFCCKKYRKIQTMCQEKLYQFHFFHLWKIKKKQKIVETVNRFEIV